MIKKVLNVEFYTKQTALLDSDIVIKHNIQDIFDYFKNKDIISVDTETTGVDYFKDEVMSLQLGYKEEIQFVINCYDFPLRLFKSLLEEKKLILQNAKFDIRFFLKEGIVPNFVYDTFLAEKRLTLGSESPKNLAALEEKYCETDIIDKEDRLLMQKQGFISRAVRYAAGDVFVLYTIFKKQMALAKELEMTRIIQLENRFVTPLAYIEHSGIYLDKEKWLKRLKKKQDQYEDVKNRLDNYVRQHPDLQKFVSKQYDMFSNSFEVLINWSSNQQVKKVFQKLGINTKVVEHGVEKDTVDAKHIVKYQHDFDIIPIYLEYKELEKVVSTYGKSFLDKIKPKTGRVHTIFTQIQNTGRMSSGKKDTVAKIKYPNLQNIPSDAETRACFTNQFEDTTLIIADYSGQEQILLANMSQDKDILSFYEQGLGDMHSFVCQKINPELQSLTLKEVKSNHPEKRQKAKAAGFAINYGGNGFTIANNLNISKEEGERIYNDYLEAFPGLKDYFSRCEKIVFEKGYVLISKVTGSKFFIEGFDEFKRMEKELENRTSDYWARYKTEKQKNSEWYQEEKKVLSKHFSLRGSIYRSALNFPIQGSSAEVTKLAYTIFFQYLKENNLLGKVLVINIVHDEICVEVPTDKAEEVSTKLKESMEEAGRLYCPTVPLKADPVITNHWTH